MEDSFVDKYVELQADFYHYMLEYGGISMKTSSDYVTRLKFLSHYYRLDETLTRERIEEILGEEENKRQHREKYAYKKSVSDFRAGLNKFLAFVQSDYHKRIDESIVSELRKVEQDGVLKATEKDAIVKSRIGQGLFRNRLMDYWRGCAVSRCPMMWMLVASHIKPWRKADDRERLDVYNGLLLLPNYDKLFDKGYITFSLRGEMMISKLLDKRDREALGLTGGLRLVKIEEAHDKYLAYHRENCFIQ